MDAVLLAHAAVALPLVGVIWFVQVVHYPLFALAGTDGWQRFHDEHSRRTTWVVAGPMLLQLATAAVLVLAPPDGLGRALPLAGLVLTLAVFAHTFGVAVPLHRRLGAGPDRAAMDRLVRANALRTALWTAHGVVVLAMLAAAG